MFHIKNGFLATFFLSPLPRYSRKGWVREKSFCKTPPNDSNTTTFIHTNLEQFRTFYNYLKICSFFISIYAYPLTFYK